MTFPPTRTIAWGESVFAVNLQARPDPDVRARLTALQTKAGDLGLGSMNVMPPGHLHLTLFSIIYVRAMYPDDPRTLWARIRPSIIDSIGAAVSGLPPIELTFEDIAVHGDAVLVRAPNHPAIERLRDAIEATLERSHAPVFRAATTHSTIARLQTPTDTPWSLLLRDLVAEPLTWPIDVLRLVEETVYPGLEQREVERFILSTNDTATAGG